MHHVGARVILNKVELPNCSMIVEAAAKLGTRGVVVEDIFRYRWHLYCCHVRRKADLIDDVLYDLILRDIGFPI